MKKKRKSIIVQMLVADNCDKDYIKSQGKLMIRFLIILLLSAGAIWVNVQAVDVNILIRVVLTLYSIPIACGVGTFMIGLLGEYIIDVVIILIRRISLKRKEKD